MARLNIEDSLFTDRRFQDLVAKTGNPDLALGIVVSAFLLAQKTWIEHGGIPIDRWPDSLNILLECKLASVSGSLIYVTGSKEQFAWLEQKSNAGKKGGKSKSPKKLKTLAQNSKRGRSETETEPKREVNAPKPLTLSLSLSPTLSTNSNSEVSFDEKNSSSAEVVELTPTQQVWESYENAYLLRWKQKPVRNAQVNSQIKKLVEKLGMDAVEVARFYVNHNKKFYVENCHSVSFLLKDAEALATQWKNNRPVTAKDAQQIEQKSIMQKTWEDIEGGIF